MSSLKLADQHPQIKAIHCSFRFVDPDAMTDTIETTDNWSPVSVSPWIIDCPYRECVNGGFDLGPTLSKATLEDSNEKNGVLVCDGWQDKERIGKHKCMCNLVFNLKIEYF